MVHCSLKRQQQNQWTRLYCLYLHLPKTTFLEGLCGPEGQIRMAWDGLEVSEPCGVPSPFPHRQNFGFPQVPLISEISLAPFPTMLITSCLSFPDERLGYWRCMSSFPMGCGMQVRQCVLSHFSRSRSGLACAATEPQHALHCMEQPIQLAALHLFWRFFLTLKHQEVKNVLWSKHILEALHLVKRSEKTWIALMLKLSW